MAEDNRVANFLARNKAYVPTHNPLPQLKDMQARGPPPHPGIVILSCFDQRIRPETFFGLQPGEAFIMANSGGRANAEVLRSLIVLDSVVGVGTVMVVHHTDCGMTHITDEIIRGKLKERAPEKAQEVEGMEFGAIGDMHQSVRDDVAIVKASPYLRKDLKVLGFVYDITSGTVEEVKVE